MQPIPSVSKKLVNLVINQLLIVMDLVKSSTRCRKLTSTVNPTHTKTHREEESRVSPPITQVLSPAVCLPSSSKISPVKMESWAEPSKSPRLTAEKLLAALSLVMSAHLSSLKNLFTLRLRKDTSKVTTHTEKRRSARLY